jgi:GDP-L-fucose synthase
LITATHEELDLEIAQDVEDFFIRWKPTVVFHAAAKVGGIFANYRKSGDFIAANLAMQQNVIMTARWQGVKKLLFFGSACAYPKFAQVPVPESALLTGELEPTNRAYAIAKIAGIELCAALRRQYGCKFYSCMPTNLYGLGDHYDLNDSHVIPGMIARIWGAFKSDAPSVMLWGTGAPTREFLFADDLAAAAIARLNVDGGPDLVNISSGEETPLSAVADLVAETVGYFGEIKWDGTRPDGTPRRALDCTAFKRLCPDWKPHIGLRLGLQQAFQEYYWNAKLDH